MWSAIVDHLVNHPRFGGPLEGATHEGIAGSPGEGPHLQLWLRVADGRIISATYQTYGCFAAIASGEMLCLILKGKTLAEAAALTPTDLTTALQGLPEGKEHCPQLAISALQRALANKDALSSGSTVM